MFNLFRRPKYWLTPPASILPDAGISDDARLEHDPSTIANLITQCGAPCRPVHASMGATVMQYHLDLIDIRDLPKIKRLAPALSAALHRNITIVTPDATSHFAIALERQYRATVPFKRTLLTHPFASEKSPTAAILGTDTAGETLGIDIADAPHLLIAGATGSGKSVCVHTIITSMLFKGTPTALQFVMIDPKLVELTAYDGLPHLMTPVITDVNEAIETLDRLCFVMDNRYRDIRKGKADHPRLVVVIDELADLMLVSRKAVETSIVRIAQLGRQCGIHLIVATQRPDVKVVTSQIRDNLPTRIALTMAPGTSARVTGVPGADKLAGKGDALFLAADHTKAITRFQGAYIGPNDIAKIVEYWRHDALHRAG